MSKKLRRKRTAKIEPISLDIRSPTADDTFGKPHDTEKTRKPRTRNNSESWSNDPNAGKFSYDNKIDSSDESQSNEALDGEDKSRNAVENSQESENEMYTMERPKPQMTGMRNPSVAKWVRCQEPLKIGIWSLPLKWYQIL